MFHVKNMNLIFHALSLESADSGGCWTQHCPAPSRLCGAMRTPQLGTPRSPGNSCIQKFTQPVLLERNINLSLPKGYETFSFGPSSRAVSWANDQRNTHSENQKSGCQGIEKLKWQYWGLEEAMCSKPCLNSPSKSIEDWFKFGSGPRHKVILSKE